MIFRAIGTRDYPTFRIRCVCFRHADGKVLEYTAEELEVGKLYGVDADVGA